ncbi:MAG: hypothetical protein ABI306_03795 [Caulobacteraceae bacterium]
MAQLLVGNIEANIKRRRRAARNDQSPKEEAPDVLGSSVARETDQPKRLGGAISARFTDAGLDEPIMEFRRGWPRFSRLTRWPMAREPQARPRTETKSSAHGSATPPLTSPSPPQTIVAAFD